MKKKQRYIEREFVLLIREVLHSREFRSMKAQRHHIHSNAFDHSLKVSYLCYRHRKRFGGEKDLREVVLAALLHDFYLYDRRAEPSHRWHLFTHPRRAAENAAARFPWLTLRQQQSIRRHMFPLTPLPPVGCDGWLLCFYDKVAAVSDYFGA